MISLLSKLYQMPKNDSLFHLNILKAEGNGFTTDLKPSDEVRIDDTV